MNLLIDHFSGLDDPREEAKVHYPLTNVLVIAVAAAIAGAESYEDIVLYGKSKATWLATFLDLTNGIPSRPFCSKRTKMGAKQAIHPSRSGLSPVCPASRPASRLASRSTSKRYRP